jgi:putative flippase GtrA
VSFPIIFKARYAAYLTAMIAANILTIINAYILHRYVTFKSKVRGRGVVLEFLKFCTTYVVTFVLNLGLLPFFVEIFGIQPKLAGAIVILICTAISYLGHPRFSFKSSKL